MCQSGQEWQKVAENRRDNITLLRMVRNIGNLTKIAFTFFDGIGDRHVSVDYEQRSARVRWKELFGELH